MTTYDYVPNNARSQNESSFTLHITNLCLANVFIVRTCQVSNSFRHVQQPSP